MISRRTVLAAPGALAAPSLARFARPAERPADGPYQWQNVTVGAGGFAPGIVFSPVQRGLAYLRTDMGGAYRWEDGAGTWTPLQDGMADGNMFGIESVAADPRDSDIVYLAAGTYRREPAAILRSGDRGRSWTVASVPFRMGGNEDGRGLGERLAINPHRTATLLFGSRHDGLQRSDDAGRSWQTVTAFPHAGLGLPAERGPTHAGIAFVVFDGRGGSRRVFAGVADPGAGRVFRSDDGGGSWSAVAGGPDALLPLKAAIDGSGALYVTWGNGVGPNGVTAGSVWRLDADGRWADITPDKSPDASAGGYMGVALDRSRPGHLLVTTINRWQPGDTVWRSTDGGRSWTDLRARSVRDVSASPFLKQGNDHAEFGHWTAGLALDPFEGRRAAYTTGATVYVTDDIGAAGAIRWRPWVRGIEQTAIISLLSPTAPGVPLVSGFGDIAGFAHDDLARSPGRMHLNPQLTNTNNLEQAGLAPAVLVRSGNRHANQPVDATLARSTDGGRNWSPVRAQLAGRPREDLDGNAHLIVGADGRTLLVATPTPLVSTDAGETWEAVNGLPERGRAVADKADGRMFYAVDFATGRFLVSNDGGRSFAASITTGLPADLSPARPRNRETPFPLVAELGHRGRLWMNIGPDIFHSNDGGRRWRQTSGTVRADLFAIGRPAPGQEAPTLFVAGTAGGVRGLFRSTDAGDRWTRIDDDAHRWGHRYRVLAGDPKRFGRLYVGTDGRGVLYGDPSS